MRPLSQIVTVALALHLAGCLWSPLLSRPPLQDETVYVTTADEWRIALHHYHPGPAAPPRGHPVILCHGISANHRMWSSDEEHSVPRFLARRGWDVWNLDLRGVGASERPSLWGKRADYGFDHYVTQDARTAIAEVLRRTGAPRAHWIGHSMGGMIIYAYIATYGDRELRSVTTLGSPVVMDGLSGIVRWAQQFAPAVTEYIVSIPERPFLPAIAPAIGVFETSIEAFFWNPDNYPRPFAQNVVYAGIDDMAAGVLRQLAVLFVGGRFTSADGQIDYLEGLRQMRVPLLVGAGMGDNLVQVSNTLPAFEKAGTPSKRLRIFARANGDAVDYGHVDLLGGLHAPADVYPELERWLTRHDGPYIPENPSGPMTHTDVP